MLVLVLMNTNTNAYTLDFGVAMSAKHKTHRCMVTSQIVLLLLLLLLPSSMLSLKEMSRLKPNRNLVENL